MKWNVKKMMAAAAAAMLALSLASCGGNSKKIENADDLVDAVIGAQTGTTGAIFIEGDIADGNLGKATLQEFKTGIDAVIALKQGKLDAVVIDSEPAKVFVEQNDGLKILETPYVVENYAIAVSKEDTELKEQMNKAIQELKDDGTLANLLDYYINKNEAAAPYTSPEGITYDGELIMATNAAFPPYEYYENDQVVGLDADIAKAICDKLGKKLVISDMDFDSIITAVQSGEKADFAAAGLTITEDRLQNVDFTDSYTTSNQVIIVKE